MCFVSQFSAVPPTAAKRLKQRRRIGVTIGLGLDQVDPSLLVGLLGAQQHKISRIAALPLFLGQFKRYAGGTRGGGRGLDGLGVLLECIQRVGDILKGRQHRAAILLGRLRIRGLRGTLLMQQRSALE